MVYNKRYSLFGFCNRPSIINEVYKLSLSEKTEKEAPYFAKALKGAKSEMVKPQCLFDLIKIYDTDCRRPALEKIAKYNTLSFKVIILDSSKQIVIPKDLRFAVGIDDNWRGLHVRAPYVDGVITYDFSSKPNLAIRVFSKPKFKESVPYTEDRIKDDVALIRSFVSLG
ncbi:MAG: hypothetical protein QXR60_02540 [Candidatus Nanoarchaeia archaeon]